MGFHIVKRENCPLGKKICFYLAAVVLALLLGAVLLIALGVNPVAYYSRADHLDHSDLQRTDGDLCPGSGHRGPDQSREHGPPGPQGERRSPPRSGHGQRDPGHRLRAGLL